MGVYTLLLCKNFFHVPKTSYGIKALAQYAKFHFYIKIIPSVASVHMQMTLSKLGQDVTDQVLGMTKRTLSFSGYKYGFA